MAGAGELEAHDLRDQQRHRLAEHRRLRLYATDAPAEHAETVHHRRVTVRADERIGIGDGNSVLGAVEHDPGEVFEIYLVNDAGVWRHDLEVRERRLPPAQERVALLISLELDLRVLAERIGRAEEIDLHGVIDHQLRGKQRIDLLGVSAHGLHGVAHRGEVDDARDAGEVLEQDARG